jgi:hypothetical protein
MIAYFKIIDKLDPTAVRRALEKAAMLGLGTASAIQI